MEMFGHVFCIARDTEFEPGLDESHVGPFSQCVVDHRLVFVHGDGTCGIDDVAACFGVGIDAVDRAEDELFLEVGEEGEVSFGLI